MAEARLETSRIRKVYPGTVALDDVSIAFAAGEVSALVGKNGAGKSTIVNILSGATRPTGGEILIDGRAVRLASPADAFRRGIATVHQELSLIPELSVAENIFLGRWPKRRGLGGGWIVDWRTVEEQAERITRSMGATVDVREKAGRLSVAQQQIVEIAKAMSFQPSAVLLDEPTSALAFHETQNLFRILRSLAGQGVAIVYITHRLQELREVADHVCVLRDGRFVGRLSIADATPTALVEMMFGQVVPTHRPAGLKVGKRPVLEVRGLRRGDVLHGVDLTLREGEVLGIAGMLGSGRTELLMSIFGAEPFDAGDIFVDGRPAPSPTPERMKNAGLGLTPENRKQQGVVLPLSTRDNACLAALKRIARRGLIWKGLQRRVVNGLVRDLQIAVADVEQPIASLSGGNQQKVVVGNWLNTQPRIMLFDEPTRGIDVQAKQQIFQIIWDLSRRGISSIFVSSELEELLEVCHRILVLRRGRVACEVPADGLRLDRLFAMCMED